MAARALNWFRVTIACFALLAILPVNSGGAFDWHLDKGCRWAEFLLPKSGQTGFTLLPASLTGITFSNRLSDTQIEKNRILENGSGVTAGDVDGDGWCDLYFCRLEGGNVLYRNLGNGKFEDITDKAGVRCPGQFSTGAVLADVDGDGDLDLLVNSVGGGTRLFLNDGKGHFKEATESGLVKKNGSHSLALADIDGDGDLDLYVVNYRASTFKDSSLRNNIRLRQVNGKLVVPPEHSEQFLIARTPGGEALLEVGEPDLLYLNDGQGHFQPVSWTNGAFADEDGRRLASPPRDWGLSAMFRDLNGDGAPDLYVCNDFFSPDRIWMNDGAGHFQAIPRLALRKTSFASMAVDFADINRDGYVDFIVVDMFSRSHLGRNIQRDNFELDPVPWWGWPWKVGALDSRPQAMRNTLFLNRGDGTYAEIAQLSGLQASGWSWGAVFLDVDLDGYEDLLVSNGHGHDMTDSDALRAMNEITSKFKPDQMPKTLPLFPRLDLAKLAFRNLGDLRFKDVGHEWGFDLVGVSHGMALADLDNDGDLDVVINTLNGPAAILRNDSIAPRVAVRLKGAKGNTQGIGAKIKVLGGAVPMQSQEVICGGRYLSGDDPMRVFAAGSLSNRLTIEVAWRNGARSLVPDARPNRIYEIDESGSEVQNPKAENPPSAIRHPPFEDVSELIKHTHRDEAFNDYERQPLLPRRLSQLGPGVAWCDLNGDGLEDLVIGSGRGGLMRVMFGNGRGGFNLIEAPVWSEPAAMDQSGIVVWSAEPGTATLLIGQSNYEQSSGASPAFLRYQVWPGGIEGPEALSPMEDSAGPVAVADVDGDGDLDLFIGGRVRGGKYPQAASSRIYRNEQGRFVLDQDNSRVLEKVGLVSGAVWADLDGDGFAELVLACEWGPIKIFRNDHGRLLPWDAPLLSTNHQPSAISQLTGWWNGISAGDIDGDGRLDLIASNWGRNSKYEEFRDDALRLYYGDLDENGTLDLVEAYWDRAMQKVVPWRDWKTMSAAMPLLKERFHTYREYGSASVEEIFGQRLEKAQELRANTVESMLFLNRGDHFEAVALPVEAQLAPAFGVNVADLDGDGHEDVFLSQNFFALDLETGRSDAGRGLWLKGDGRGGLRAIPGQESGILVYGEQRGSAVADYDGDGRVDLVVTQNGGQTKLFHNLAARPGLRVRLKGPTGNRTGIGAVLRLKANHAGPWGSVREIHGGSGYWSQDSAIAVMSVAAGAEPEQLSVLWPGGKTTRADVPTGAKEIEVEVNGKIKVLK